MIIFLHGAGGAGRDNRSQLTRGNGLAMSALIKTPCRILAPQCPGSESWWSPNAAPSRCGQLLLRLVADFAAQSDVDSRRIYLIGVSMGGHGVWDLAWRSPGLFAALVPICAACPPQRADTFESLPVWGFHGSEDREVPVDKTRSFFELLRGRGWDARFTELPGIGHSCTREVFEQFDIGPWLLSQSRPS